MISLTESIVTLITKASTDLPPDVEGALKAAWEAEEEGSLPKNTFAKILENVALAREKVTPICQDTGSLTFYIDYPRGSDERPIVGSIREAAEICTKRYLLRPNAVEPVTGKNSGTNLGVNAPYIHAHPWDKEGIQIRLMLKGGGSENVSTQYKLPDSALKAGRDLKGVKKCVLDAAFQAQGKGCAPGALGVGIGGDRMTSYMLAKEQLFRKIGQRSDQPDLAALETDLLRSINSLEIGPMGFGGKTTVFEVFCGSQHRHPATYYVTVAYMCWAFRRKTMTVQDGEVIYGD